MRHDIKTTVDKIVSKYNTRDPYELCDYMNVLLQIGDLGSALGCYLLIKRQKCIILNERILRTPLEKVVLSHELGHSNMHWKNDCYFYGSTLFSKSKEENEANSFAAELLVPDDLIYEHPGMTKNQIARILGYDERIMEFKKYIDVTRTSADIRENVVFSRHSVRGRKKMGFTDIFKIKEFKAEIEQLRQENQSLLSKNEAAHKQLSDLGALDYYEIKEKTMRLENDFIEKEKQLKSDYSSKTQNAEDEFKKTISDFERMTSDRSAKCQQILEQLNELRLQEAKINKSVKTQTNKLNRSKELVKAINYTFDKYLNYEPSQSILRFPDDKLQELEEISPSVILKLHCMDVKDLRKAYRDNDKQIDTILKKYSARYTTKANQAIYKLMVIALRAELQNVLYNLKYEKLDKSVEDIKSVTRKYLKIAGEGNQSIAGTLAKFIGEIEYLFINAVKIEYNYYVKKEQARQEQLAIREQMRQEAEERKALEAERKKVEQEECKYTAEIEKLKEQLTVAKDNELEMLNARILELQAQLADVVIKKEEISNLANGKAGNVYVISNLGSFGNDVFKIGMTRRLNPQDRVNELGDASVPFKFDVHSFIFSEDAVSLENKLHSILNDKRVNKVNMRKEFFYTSVDELEELVTQIEPTAEFNKTMLAEEFRQSQSSESLYTSDYTLDEEDDEEE